jgi:hypothetical protein
MARIARRLAPQPNGKQNCFAHPQLDSFGVDSKFETARSSSAFYFVLWLFKMPGIASPRSRRIPQFYVQRRSDFC